jgi:hypothetical protein
MLLGMPEDTIRGRKELQKLGFESLPGLRDLLHPAYRDYATTQLTSHPSIPDPRIDQTDDQALGRPRVIYPFKPTPNKPSIPDPRIDQIDDRPLDLGTQYRE